MGFDITRLSEDELLDLNRRVVELAARYRVPIVEDDTYRELALTGAPPPPSLFTLDEGHAVVIRINSFSKMLAPGLRLGWISAVQPIVDQLALIKQVVDPHTQNLSQMVVCELVANGTIDAHLTTLGGDHQLRICYTAQPAARAAAAAKTLARAISAAAEEAPAANVRVV